MSGEFEYWVPQIAITSWDDGRTDERVRYFDGAVILDGIGYPHAPDEETVFGRWLCSDSMLMVQFDDNFCGPNDPDAGVCQQQPLAYGDLAVLVTDAAVRCSFIDARSEKFGAFVCGWSKTGKGKYRICAFTLRF